jgi:hypothetical protein
MKQCGFLIAAALLIAGCAKRDEADASGSYAAAETMKSSGAPASSVEFRGGSSMPADDMAEARLTSQTVPGNESLNKAAAARATKRAVIRNGTLTIRVDNVEKAEKQVGKLVDQLGGYISNSSLSSEAQQLTLSLKIPAGEFDGTMTSLEGLGTRITKNVTTQDVTAELVDLDARLKIMRAQEDAFRNMLKKASGQQEMMDIQTRVMELRSQIESLAAQQKSLGDLAALSTIELTMQQSTVTAAAGTDPKWSQEAWGSASSALMTVSRGLGTLGIWILLFAPIWIPALLLTRWLIRNYRRPQTQI